MKTLAFLASLFFPLVAHAQGTEALKKSLSAYSCFYWTACEPGVRNCSESIRLRLSDATFLRMLASQLALACFYRC